MNVPFSVEFVFVVAPFLSVVSIVVAMANAKKQEEKLFNLGISYLKGLRSLLMYIQQHRGLSNSYLNGNRQTEAEIASLEVIIRKEINDLEDIGTWLLTNPKWESIIDHWSRLTVSYKTADVENNLKQHNNLIANLLYLIDDLAYAHQLGKLGMVDATDSDWRHLLSLAEYIGQARALGMGAVSRGHCTELLRSQLTHLREKIEANINRNWADITQHDFHLLLTAIDRQVLVEKTSISPTDYFQIATACIRHVLIEFDNQVEKMQFQRK
ncbi:MAG TPA: nitrate- and nitrite sensing domain-containing protein [Cellvibrio sp.]|nr:nitrate- and nitrite sensing domain-containing protein [Cellvibrio sp.]